MRSTSSRWSCFKQAYDITGHGEEAGDKYDVHSKEQADHSLPYLVAVALLDGEVSPRQFNQERICRGDVQQLLRKVHTLRDDTYTQRYPDQTPSRIEVRLKDGRTLRQQKSDWAGSFKRPLDWQAVRSKFDNLADEHADAGLRDEIADAVGRIEQIQVSELTHLLARLHRERT
jgi:2-methylcitrate dehydratase